MPLKNILFNLFVISLFCSSAWSFIPDVKYIFDDLTRNNISVSYKFEQLRTVYDKRLPDGKIVIKEKVYVKEPWKYARISRASGKSLMDVYDGTEFLKVADGKRVRLKESLKLPILYGFYLSKNPDQLSSFLSVNGINTSSTSLSRKDSLLAIFFGGNRGNGPKLWVDRGAFWPLAYMRKETDAGKPYIVDVEDVFMNYRNVAKGVYFPMKITTFSDGERTEEVEITKIEQNAKIPGKLFDINYLKSKYSLGNDYYSGDRAYFSRIEP